MKLGKKPFTKNLVYSNYDALLQYNCAHSYAVGVALLADAAVSPIDPAKIARAVAPKKSRRPPAKRQTKRKS